MHQLRKGVERLCSSSSSRLRQKLGERYATSKSGNDSPVAAKGLGMQKSSGMYLHSFFNVIFEYELVSKFLYFFNL